MPVSSALASELDRLTLQEKAAVADALLRQLEEKWLPDDAQLAELQRREEVAEKKPDSTLSVGEEIRRLRR
ncbi:MAG TPA: hypothetical protein VGA56_17970 [Opitutaceae bacterium]